MSANGDDFEFNIRDSMYFRFSLIYMHILPRYLRKAIEFVTLFMALLLFYEFICFHKMSANSAHCLDHVVDIWPKDGIIRVEIIQSYERFPVQNGIINKFRTVENSYESEYRLENILYKRNKVLSLFNDFTKPSNLKKKEEVDTETSTIELVENKFRETRTTKHNFYSETNDINVEDEKKNMSIPSQFHATECTNNYFIDVLGVKNCLLYQSTSTTLPLNEKKDKGIFYENYIAEFSLKVEYLFLSSDVRDGLRIPVMLVTLDPSYNKCFGNWLNRYFLENYIGYDELLFASFKFVAQFEENKGFCRDVITRKHCSNMEGSQNNRLSYIFSWFIMMMITCLISLYMRYLNHRLIVCFNYLLYHFNGEISLMRFYVCFMGFLGLVSLVWLYFKDLNSLFYIIFIVVMGEMYYSLFIQCPTTKKHWPKFFYLYLFAFYAYDYRFDGQYRLLSLACTWYFILHSMVYFYHHVELPHVLLQVELQEITIQQQLQQLRQQDRPGFLAP